MTQTARAYMTAAMMVFIVGALSLAFGFAYANPSFFISGVASAAATTSVTYMTPGTATTTIVQPAYLNGNSTGIDSATLMVQFTGSSTLSLLDVAFEYADLTGVDCYANPSGCDWYRNTLLGEGVVATTTGTLIANVNSYRFAFASTTQGGAAGTSARTNYILTAPTPAPFVRAVITMPAGSARGAVWAKFLPVKEAR